MKLKVRDMDVETGGIRIVILNKEDAIKLDLHPGDRVRISKGKRKQIAVVDVAVSPKSVPPGKIGMFEEILKDIKAKHGDVVHVMIEDKPKTVYYIKKKLKGAKLSYKEIYAIIKDIVDNKLTDIEISFFVAAIYQNPLSMEETKALTKAIVVTGDVLKFKKRKIVDKHCIGGVPNNRTSMVLVPIVAAAGLIIPKTSSRSITSPSGTADTMEVLTNVSLSPNKIRKVVRQTNGCLIWGGAMRIAPADDRIIVVERPLSLDPESQLLASVMAKKRSVGSNYVLIDIPLGKTAKVYDLSKAKRLKRNFEKIGKMFGMKLKVIITDGSQPIGNGIGPVLEARDVLWILKNDRRAPIDLKKKALMMATELLKLAGKKNPRNLAKEILESGKAYKKFIEIIKAQGAKITNVEMLKPGKFTIDVVAEKTGRVKEINNKKISKVARVAGAPRDKEAGIYLHKHVGDSVKKGEKLFTIYAQSNQKLKYAEEVYELIGGYTVG